MCESMERDIHLLSHHQHPYVCPDGTFDCLKGKKSSPADIGIPRQGTVGIPLVVHPLIDPLLCMPLVTHPWSALPVKHAVS